MSGCLATWPAAHWREILCTEDCEHTSASHSWESQVSESAFYVDVMYPVSKKYNQRALLALDGGSDQFLFLEVPTYLPSIGDYYKPVLHLGLRGHPKDEVESTGLCGTVLTADHFAWMPESRVRELALSSGVDLPKDSERKRQTSKGRRPRSEAV